MEKNDKTAGALLVLLFGCGLYMSGSFPERSAYFPQFICIVGLLLSVLLIVLAFVREKKGGKKADESKIQPKQRKRLVLMGALIILYVIAMQVIGFTVSTVAFMIAGAVMLYPGDLAKEGRKPVLIITAASLVISVMILIIFKNLLYVPLPSGLLF